MDWPARSPDLNPIEHVWDFLGRRLAARTLPPVTIRELRLALQDEWAAMPQQLIDTLILSMGRRCETCLAIVRVHYFERGGFVGYRSRASSKHLSPHLPVDELDSSGVKKGLRYRCKMHVWVSGPQRNRLDVDVWRSDVTALALSYRTFPLRKV
ncbi:hypothetical protein TNCV_2032931 [Trichonephila clavipes]|nr:hypothetical protein TNCV_2032931 [Trichonephila clavipes]